MTYIFRRISLAMVASALVFSGCLSKNTQKDNWKTVYEQSCKNKDYQTAIVALNNLIITDKEHLAEHYDSLSTFYIKRLRNLQAGSNFLDSALKLNPNNVNALELKSLTLIAMGKVDEALKTSENLVKVSPKLKAKYIDAQIKFYKSNNLAEYTSVINQIIYGHPDTKEFYEAQIDEYNVQNINLRAVCYYEKAKMYLNEKNVMKAISNIDSALMISPDFAEAQYVKEKVMGGAAGNMQQ